MATGGQKRTRSERVAALELPPGQWERVWAGVRRRGVVVRMGLALVASVALAVVIRGWDPPFACRTGYAPPSDIVAKVSFSKPNLEWTQVAKEIAQSRVRCIFVQHPERLVQLRTLLRNKIVDVARAEKLSDLDPTLWEKFQPIARLGGVQAIKRTRQEEFLAFRRELDTPEKLAQFDKAVAAAFAPFEQRGLLEKLPGEMSKANPDEIMVYPVGHPQSKQAVKVSDVLISEGQAIHQSLLDQLGSADLADRIFAWVRPQLSWTLELAEEETKRALDEAAASVGEELMYVVRGSTLAPAGQPIDRKQLHVLRLAHEAAVAQRGWTERIARVTALVAMFFGLMMLTGLYMRYRHYGLLASIPLFATLLAGMVATAALCFLASADAWRAEIIPLAIFGITTAIACRQELALVQSGITAAIVAIGCGQGLSGFLVLTGTAIAAVLQVGQIRSRARLIEVGLVSAALGIVLSLIVSLLADQPVVLADGSLNVYLLGNVAFLGLWTVAAGFLMTGLLPFVEKSFGVLTYLSLLELGDVAHPLLQELVRRAPATYNHSITVGSLAEAAADSIGARGLLVRVGAYFHDIGKMLKPAYFIENQGHQENLHEALVPAMSTLVIIAHIKDGADLGRQCHLPRPIIDLIEQHHGTTLVEFFYGRASEQQRQTDPDGEVDESAYRYPGPKPQTKEAAVLMLVDAVESATRSLTDPGPARIEGLVRDLSERRLHDGQFDESGLTLSELRTIERSLVKSVTALYHGRIKYPEQKTA
jgi:putative nucleotidyltransferase with HDIG domain